jgi:hypothetical protein
VRGDWLYVDFVRGFMPNWLAKMTSLKVFSLVVMALLMFVIVVKVRG